MEQNSVSVEMTNIGSLMFKVELLQKTEDVTLTSPIPSGLQVEKTSPWMVHCGVHGKVHFSSMLENLNKGCHPNIPPLPHVFLCLTLAKGTIQPIVINFGNHYLLLNFQPLVHFLISVESLTEETLMTMDTLMWMFRTLLVTLLFTVIKPDHYLFLETLMESAELN